MMLSHEDEDALRQRKKNSTRAERVDMDDSNM